jgi:hypothetical protein
LLLERIAKGNTRCQTCGGDLVLPEGILEAGQAHAEKLKPKKVQVANCPCCDRTARGDVHHRTEELSCMFCGMTFRISPQGEHVLGPVGTGDTITVEHLAANHGWLGQSDPFLAQVLGARAYKGELVASEPAILEKRLYDISQLGAQPLMALPISVGEAPKILPQLFFSGHTHSVQWHGPTAQVMLEYVVDQNSRLNSDLAKKAVGLAAINAAGLGAMVLTGSGFVAMPGMGGDGDVKINHQTFRVIFSCTGQEGRTTFQVYTQLNDDEAKSFPPEANVELAQAIRFAPRPVSLGPDKGG